MSKKRAKQYVDVILYERKLTDLRFDLEEKARLIQAIEYERRLLELNNAHARAEQILNTYVTEEVYNSNHEDLRKRLDKVEKDQAEQTGRYAAVGLLVTIGLLITTVAVNVLLHYT